MENKFLKEIFLNIHQIRFDASYQTLYLYQNKNTFSTMNKDEIVNYLFQKVASLDLIKIEKDNPIIQYIPTTITESESMKKWYSILVMLHYKIKSGLLPLAMINTICVQKYNFTLPFEIREDCIVLTKDLPISDGDIFNSIENECIEEKRLMLSMIDYINELIIETNNNIKKDIIKLVNSYKEAK